MRSTTPCWRPSSWWRSCPACCSRAGGAACAGLSHGPGPDGAPEAPGGRLARDRWLRLPGAGARRAWSGAWRVVSFLLLHAALPLALLRAPALLGRGWFVVPGFLPDYFAVAVGAIAVLVSVGAGRLLLAVVPGVRSRVMR